MNIETNQLFKLLLSEIGELLSYVNTDSASVDYGCAHEAYWKKLEDPSIPNLDFSNARWQEAAYTFALLYNHQLKDNIYYRDANLLPIIKAIFRYWTSIQHNDGSFDEWRREEHGQPPTAFSLFAMSRAYDLCGEHFDENERNAILSAFRKAAMFLVNNEELVATNHEVVAVAALASYISVDNSLQKIIKSSIDNKIERIGENFCEEEGWLLEIDGPDTGYNNVSLAYLAVFWELTGDARILAMMEKIIHFNRLLTYPDGLVGGGTNSRYSYLNCPLAYMMTKDVIPESGFLLGHFLNSINVFAKNGKYFSKQYHRGVILYFYILTVIKSEPGGPENVKNYSLPLGSKILKKANILIINTVNNYAVVGWGASIGALYNKKTSRNIVFSSPIGWANQSCIFAELMDGGFISTLFKKNKFETLILDSVYECKGALLSFSKNEAARWGLREDYKLKTRIFSFIKSIPFALQFGRRFWFEIAKPVKEFIVNALKSKYIAERSLSLKGDDELQFKNALKTGRDTVKHIYVQETLYHRDDSSNYAFDGERRQESPDGVISFLSDTVLIKDKNTNAKIASFNFDFPVNISVNTLNRTASEAIIQNAVGYLTKIRFQPLYNEHDKGYYLNYTLKIF